LDFLIKTNGKKGKADVCGWGAFGDHFPEFEVPNPHILFSQGQNQLRYQLSESRKKHSGLK